jgi:hypothetical protein
MSSRNERRTYEMLQVMNKENNNANNINQTRVRSLINNSDTIDRIARIASTPQITNNPLVKNFFDGVKFSDDNSFEASISPAGCLPSSSSFS